MASHPLGLPLRPLARLGWAGSGLIWIGFIVVYATALRFDSPWVATIATVYVSWVVYSWIYPPLMKRWVKSRGIG